ncbi:hypothetical protein FHS15_002538 [Paenibacillus castaneae]|uniref:YqzL family protein n=1 Tax=Paenibacillus castaneae TaxID=474957 RepID=UPI000C9B0A32|nr:YqzL family protein [Paenibacillus castaneae]NIK77402.1 hypothetical protein [Paenibacillus castaneae]
MRDFSWKYFTLTGDVESFMLYKEMKQLGAEGRTDTIDSVNEEFATLELDGTSS